MRERINKSLCTKLVMQGRIPVTVRTPARIEKKTFERLEKFCEDSGLRKTVTLERALNMYMDEYYGKIGQSGIVLKG